MINKDFSNALSAALKPAEAVQKLFERLDLGRNTAFVEEDKTFHRLNLMAVTKAKMGLEKSIEALELLKKQIEAGRKPSGLRSDTISEELFHEACRMGDVKLAGYAMVDNVAIPIIERYMEVLSMLLVYMNDVEEAARRRAKEAVALDPVTIAENSNSGVALSDGFLITSDEVEIRRATTS